MFIQLFRQDCYLAKFTHLSVFKKQHFIVKKVEISPLKPDMSSRQSTLMKLSAPEIISYNFLPSFLPSSFLFFSFLSFLFTFCPCGRACRILVPQPGMEPALPAVEVQSPRHWTTREFPGTTFFGGGTKEKLLLPSQAVVKQTSPPSRYVVFEKVTICSSQKLFPIQIKF